jgi:hypothetical protein
MRGKKKNKNYKGEFFFFHYLAKDDLDRGELRSVECFLRNETWTADHLEK